MCTFLQILCEKVAFAHLEIPGKNLTFSMSTLRTRFSYSLHLFLGESNSFGFEACIKEKCLIQQPLLRYLPTSNSRIHISAPFETFSLFVAKIKLMKKILTWHEIPYLLAFRPSHVTCVLHYKWRQFARANIVAMNGRLLLTLGCSLAQR